MSAKLIYLITDVDGVIFDRMPAIMTAFVEVMRPLGIPEERVISYTQNSLGATFESQTKGLLAESGKTISDDDVRLARRRFWEIFDANQTAVFPGVKDTLEYLKARQIKILASTGSKTSEVEDLFAKFSLPCDFILGSDKIAKGDEHINVFARHFSIAKTDFCREAAFVGDGTVDMQIAARNGIYSIGITNSIPAAPLIAAGAQTIIANFSEITKFMITG